ncbi:MAG: BatD family protein [Bacteroidota bacterium]
MKQLFCLLCMVFTSLGVWGQSFQAFLSSPTVQQGQTFTVTFTAENLEEGEFNAPDFGKLESLGAPKMSQGIQIVNGNVSRSVSYTYYLRSSQKGTFRVGAASYKTPKKTYTTQKLQVKIVAGQAQKSTPNNRYDPNARKANVDAASLAENVFLRAYTNKRKVYQGEQLTLAYKVYTQRGYNIVGASSPEQPDYDGFWIEPIENKESRYRPDKYQGKDYNSFVIDQMVLIPQKTGKLKIQAFQLQTTIQILVRNQKPQSFFDSFFDRYQNVELPLESNELELEVLPLPKRAKPDAFTGAVGTYEMEVSLDTTKAQTGEALTLRVDIKGKGYLKAINLPPIEFPEGFDAFTPKVNDQQSRAGGMITSQKTIEYVLVPRNPGSFELPKVEFAFFDIADGRYKVLKGPQFVVEVDGEALGGPEEEIEIGAEGNGGPVFYGINEDPGYPRTYNSLAGSAAFWGIWVLPIVLFIGFYFFQEQRQKKAADVTGNKRRNASKEAIKRLAAANTHLKKKDEKAFYDELVRAMYGYVGDKLNLRPSALSRENISEALRAENVAESRVESFTRILDDSEMALFAPMAVAGGMQSMYDKASALITEMEQDIEAV